MKVHWYSDNRVTGCHVIHPQPHPRLLKKGVGKMVVSNNPKEVTCAYCKDLLAAKGLLE